MPGLPTMVILMSEKSERILPTARVQVEFTVTDGPQVEIVEEDTEKAVGPLVTRERAWRPSDLTQTQITPRGDE